MQAMNGYGQWQGILLGQYADSAAFNTALQNAARRQGIAANWTTWDWRTGEDTVFFVAFQPV